MALIRKKKRSKVEAETAPQAPVPTRKPRRGRGWRWWLLRWTFRLGLWALLAFAALTAYIWIGLDRQGVFAIPEREPGIMLVASDGKVLSERGAFFGDDVRIDELPDYVPDAVIAIEDRRFRSHFGIDPIGLARAMLTNLRAGRVVEGGSTITQQLAKNLFLKPERTFERKLQEMVLALWLESKFTKDEILQLYLNRVYFGSGATGIEKASIKYFGHSARELTIAEAASLAAVLKAPSVLNPLTSPAENAARAADVIKDMHEIGAISDMEAQVAIAAPAEARTEKPTAGAGYIVDWVMEQLPDLIGKFDQSIIVETTIDRRLQALAEKAVRARLDTEGAKAKATQGAAVLLGPDGAVLAMVGGRSYVKSQYNRITKAKRQPGSAFKPFVYLAALEKGYSPNSTEIDSPVRLGDWEPENYKHQYLGQVSLMDALALSLNTVAVKLAVKLGPDHIIETARRLGITSDLAPDATLALGTSVVSPLEMATAYTSFANGGNGAIPHVVRRITARDGTLLYERRGSGIGPVMSAANMGAMNHMLRQVILSGTGTYTAIDGLDLAGKTGTTQDYRDAWFIGYSSRYVCAVWVGNDDNSPMRRVTGGGMPAHIWKDIMAPAHKGLDTPSLPGEAPGLFSADKGLLGAFTDMLRKGSEKPRNLLDWWKQKLQ